QRRARSDRRDPQSAARAGEPRRSRLRGRPARQSHAALPARSRSAPHAEGHVAAPAALEMEVRALYRPLVLVTTVLAFVVVVVGAYVRLNDAGLGCPDWPGCYGELTPQSARLHIDRAVEAHGGEHGPVSLGKAW